MSMRARSLFLMAAVLGAAAPAGAAIPSSLFAGTIEQNVVTTGGLWCGVDSGTSTYLYTASARTAEMSFAALTYSNGSAGNTNVAFTLNGQAVLTFSGPRKGNINFIAPSYVPNDIKSATFIAFSQQYDATTRELTVSFKIEFPNCTLPVSAIYRN